MPNEKILPNKIVVNNTIFYVSGDLDSSNKNLETDLKEKFYWIRSDNPNFKFWFNLFKCFYNYGFGPVNTNKIATEALLLINNEKSPSSDMDVKIIPCLKIAELMTVDCRDVAEHYIKFLFPRFFPSIYNNNSPYLVTYPKRTELNVEIQNSEKFSVTQINHLNISLSENIPEVLAKITYTWNNTPLLKFDKSKGWQGILKLNCKVYKMEHWKPIMKIITNPSDLSTRIDLLPGLHFSKRINRNSKS